MSTIIVLSDGSTFDSEAEVLILTDEARDLLEGYGDAKVLEDHHVVECVTLNDLLKLWNETHGTEF